MHFAVVCTFDWNSKESHTRVFSDTWPQRVKSFRVPTLVDRYDSVLNLSFIRIPIILSILFDFISLSLPGIIVRHLALSVFYIECQLLNFCLASYMIFARIASSLTQIRCRPISLSIAFDIGCLFVSHLKAQSYRCKLLGQLIKFAAKILELALD